jgi:tetratricopeptide (TPR) repeat protein
MNRVGRARISIVRSTEPTLVRYAAAAADMGGIVVPWSPPGKPYAAARALLERLCERTTSVVDAPAAGDVYRAMLPRADANDGDRLDAWEQALAFVLEAECSSILVHARRIDLSSLRLLRHAWRRASCAPPLIVLDSPPLVAEREEPIARVLYERASEEIAQLRALPWARRETLTEVEPGPRSTRTPLATAPLTGTFEDACQAFGEHAFDAALLLGRALLAPRSAGASEEPPSPRERAMLHAICGMSAAALGNASLEAFVDEHLRAALSAELDPPVRACVLLAQCAAAPSLDAARRAIEASRRVPPATGRYLEAWGRRARAEELVLAGRIDDAVDDLEEAASLVSAAPLDVPEPEIHRTQHLLALDLARTVARRGDVDGAVAWRAQASACAALLPTGWTLPRAPLDLEVDRYRIGAAIRERHVRATDARAQWDARAEEEALREISLLHGCRGEAARALACARLARKLAEARRAAPRALLVAELACTRAAYRAGRFEAAEAGVTAALANMDDLAEEAELHGLLACIAARRGQTARAEDASLEALARLDANAPADIAARVLVRVGEAYLALERKDAAQRVFALALGWSDDLARDALSSSERLALLLGVWESSSRARDSALVDDALACVDDALTDPEAWWLIPRVLAMVDGVYLDLADERFATIEMLRKLAAQRGPRAGSEPPPSQRPYAKKPQKKAFLYM